MSTLSARWHASNECLLARAHAFSARKKHDVLVATLHETRAVLEDKLQRQPKPRPTAKALQTIGTIPDEGAATAPTSASYFSRGPASWRRGAPEDRGCVAAVGGTRVAFPVPAC